LSAPGEEIVEQGVKVGGKAVGGLSGLGIGDWGLRIGLRGEAGLEAGEQPAALVWGDRIRCRFESHFHLREGKLIKSCRARRLTAQHTS
jgi:hypothetical protein